MQNFKKSFVTILLIVVILASFTLINKYILKNNSIDAYVYDNALMNRVLSDDVVSINYDFISKDLDSVDEILNDSLAKEIDVKKKTEYYGIAQDIYQNKINEITRVLNEKLDDEDFERLQIDLDEFSKNIDMAIEEIKNTNKSSIDVLYNSNKYMYEEKQRKCREIIDNYKGFLKE